ncbi:unnamed protein product, partial [Rotaria magnacalcarata]
MANKKSVKRCSRRKASIRVAQNRQIQATTLNLTTSSIRSSLPSQQKIKKQTKLDLTSTSSKG